MVVVSHIGWLYVGVFIPESCTLVEPVESHHDTSRILPSFLFFFYSAWLKSTIFFFLYLFSFCFFSQLVFNILNFDSELCWFLFHVFLSVFLPAAELSLLLREMILKLFSEHLSADGKVMLSLMLTECMLLFCKSNSAFGSVPHSV